MNNNYKNDLKLVIEKTLRHIFDSCIRNSIIKVVSVEFKPNSTSYNKALKLVGLSIENSMFYILKDLLENNFDLVKEVIQDMDYISEEEKKYSINYLQEWIKFTTKEVH